MIKCVNSPNFLWKIENFTSVQKKICPAVLIGGLKWQLTFSLFMEDGSEMIRLTLECLNASELLSTFQFEINVAFVYADGHTSNLKSAYYSLKIKELCVYYNSVSAIYKHFGRVNDITFLVVITPTGNIQSLFNDQEKGEYFSKYICILLNLTVCYF